VISECYANEHHGISDLPTSDLIYISYFEIRQQQFYKHLSKLENSRKTPCVLKGISVLRHYDSAGVWAVYFLGHSLQIYPQS